MFESLTEKLNGVFQKITGRGRLTERDVDEALRQVRMVLLEADVNLRVARDFVAAVRERAVGKDVLESLTPGQQVIKIVHDELLNLLGAGEGRLTAAATPPSVVMLVGLQGSGKTTTAAKLALLLRRSGQRALLIAADVYRPAAIDQLVVLGRQLDLPVHSEATTVPPATIVANGLRRARELGLAWVIVDTAGRLHIDDEMMAELKALKAAVNPSDVLLVVDAMTGQDAVRAAEAFHEAVGLTGLVLAKMDGDARGGAALSVRAVTGVPVKFLGTGEKPDALETFYPDRLASRILGMGDVLTLIEKAQQQVDVKQAQELERKLRTDSLDLNDVLNQFRQLRQMGPLQQLLEMIPGFSALKQKQSAALPQERDMKRMEAIILSMTPGERASPDVLDSSRRRRIAKGSGTSVQEVNQLLNQFREMRKMMRGLAQGRAPFAMPGLGRR